MASSMEKWQTATQPPSVVQWFRGLFERAGVRVRDTGEAFTCAHLGDRIEFRDGIDDANVDFVVEIEAWQVDRLLESVGDGMLDEREQFRVMAALASPATEAALKRPVIKNRFLRGMLLKLGNAEPLMHVVLIAPPGEEEACHTIAYVDGQTLVIPGLHGRVPRQYRLTVPDAIEYQRRMLAARRANRASSWLAFARWYRGMRKRVAVPVRT
jgi:hypothetical protein